MEFEVEADGTVKIEPISGNPVVKKVLTETDLAKGIDESDRHGVFTAGFGSGGSADPVKVDMYSSIGDIVYDDFRKATFSFACAAALPALSIGNLVALKQLTTGYFRITLPRRNNFELWGSVTELPGIESKAVKTGTEVLDAATQRPRSLSDMKKYGEIGKSGYDEVKKSGGFGPAAEDWLSKMKLSSFKADFTKTLTIGVGFGIICESRELKPLVDKAIEPKAKPIVARDTFGYATGRIEEFFARDSASIDLVRQKKSGADMVAYQTTRIGIELFLASNLYLMLSPASVLILGGHASPEGPEGPLPDGVDDPYNHELSFARADAVYGAILDAMQVWTGRWTEQLEFDAFGELRARAGAPEGGGGLSDPPSTTNTDIFAAWCRSHRDQVAKWPEWRRVEVKIGGFAKAEFYE